MIYFEIINNKKNMIYSNIVILIDEIILLSMSFFISTYYKYYQLKYFNWFIKKDQYYSKLSFLSSYIAIRLYVM